VFKKGPDYIDAGWLGLAAAGACYNLDSYLFDAETVTRSFVTRAGNKDIAIVEGNRGLFDGVDAAGSFSTAEMAKLLHAPVVLILDVTKVTRTAAALVVGCKGLDPHLDLRAVILNRVGGSRHEQVVRESVEAATGIPVVGSIRKLQLRDFPQRHLGLLPLQEHPGAMDFIAHAARLAEESIDLERIRELAASAPPLPVDADSSLSEAVQDYPAPSVRIGVIRDSAFQFYYPENLEALQQKGAELVFVSALEESDFPEVDALYIGGGFPETHAARLAGNRSFRESLLGAVRNGLPVYAECGGLMYLSRHLCMDAETYPMVGVFPIDTVLQRKPQGLGYIRVEVRAENPFYPRGTILTGHEFHYSAVSGLDEAGTATAFRVLRGHGVDGVRDGICVLNALGTYVHVHALGEPLWAEGLVRKAREYRNLRPSGERPCHGCTMDRSVPQPKAWEANR
jgi:cobyrinic acid a,c-diamide synthase